MENMLQKAKYAGSGVEQTQYITTFDVVNEALAEANELSANVMRIIEHLTGVSSINEKKTTANDEPYGSLPLIRSRAIASKELVKNAREALLRFEREI